MDIIEANECLRSWFGSPGKGTFDGDVQQQDDIPEAVADGSAHEGEEDEMEVNNGSDNELRELAEESSSDTKDILLSDEDDSIDLET